MAYIKGEIILASDYNTFRDSLAAVYDVGNGDSGYGQVVLGATALPSVLLGDVINSNEWTIFRNAAQICSDHQGSITTFPPAPELAVGEIIEAHESDPPTSDPYDIDGSLATITSNRLVFDAGSVSLFANELNSTRAVAWSNQLTHRFTATWADVDFARYFFNSGGQIRIRGSRSGGSASTQNDSWTDMLLNMGSITMDHTSTFLQGLGAGWTIDTPTTGYYDLTTSFVNIATGVPAGGGTYAGNSVTVEARTVDGPGGANGDNGRVLEFRVRYTDGHVNAFFDTVDGTITSDVDVQRATSPLSSIPTPAFSSSVLLTAGT